MRERIRVLEIVDKPFMGGGQIHLLSLAQGLDRDKFDVFVCPQEGGALADELRTQGITHVPIPFQKGRWQQNVREIASILEAQRIEIIHTHGGVAGLYGRWAARKCRTPVIVHTLHGIGDDPQSGLALCAHGAVYQHRSRPGGARVHHKLPPAAPHALPTGMRFDLGAVHEDDLVPIGPLRLSLHGPLQASMPHVYGERMLWDCPGGVVAKAVETTIYCLRGDDGCAG